MKQFQLFTLILIEPSHNGSRSFKTYLFSSACTHIREIACRRAQRKAPSIPFAMIPSFCVLLFPIEEWSACHKTCLFRSLSLSYQKRDWRGEGSRQSFFWYDTGYKVQDGTWTFEHKILKKLLKSNAYLKDMPLAAHLHGVTMQKVPQIPRQKTGEI